MNLVKPGPGQESVWDYPRPPRVEPNRRHLVVEFAGQVVAETHQGLRVLETSHPPTFYIPLDEVRRDALQASTRQTFCEYKGWASYWSLRVSGRVSENAAWYYLHPSPGYEALRDTVAFYPSRAAACYVDGERVKAQPGDFYGGWITPDVVGPFKGEPGSSGW